jgi:hypothetical protein
MDTNGDPGLSSEKNSQRRHLLSRGVAHYLRRGLLRLRAELLSCGHGAGEAAEQAGTCAWGDIVVAYNLWSARRVYRETLIGTSIIVVVAFTLIPVVNLPVWQPVIRWILRS